jgi:hypothetical protein
MIEIKKKELEEENKIQEYGRKKEMVDKLKKDREE